jgi:ABC-type multidrug transport system permease subunit
MLQLRSDKTALFFCYVLPVLLLLGIGYPLQMKNDPKIALFYTVYAANASGYALVNYLQTQPLVKLQPYQDAKMPARKALESNDIKHYLEIRSSGLALYSNSLAMNQIENVALQSILEGYLGGPRQSGLARQTVVSGISTSYVVTLLPGLIGMTLLIAGLGGFGAVLIAEQHQGLYKNIKTIDVSPIPFLAGLFASRLLLSYSVAAALVGLAAFVFGISVHVNYVLLAFMITLGCVAFLGLGLMLSTLSPSVSAFSGIVNAVQMPLLVLGGVFFSVSTFPSWLQTVANLLPLTQLNTAMRSILFESVGFGNLSRLYPQIATLMVWCVLTLAVARLRFKW